MRTLPTIILALISISLSAQGLEDQLREDLISKWERARDYTLELLEAVPGDQVDFRATPEVRSFAMQILHMNQGTIGLVANGTGQERIYPGVNLEEQTDLHSKEELIRVSTEVYDFAIAGIKDMDMSTCKEVVTRGNFNITRLEWILKGFEHQTHHRGQLVVYLRLMGIKPPNEKLF